LEAKQPLVLDVRQHNGGSMGAGRSGKDRDSVERGNDSDSHITDKYDDDVSSVEGYPAAIRFKSLVIPKQRLIAGMAPLQASVPIAISAHVSKSANYELVTQ
jgi:hypothetical protein